MFKPVIATEIEFYLHEADKKFAPEAIIALIRENCIRSGIAVCSVQQERGLNQYEIALTLSRDKTSIVSQTLRFKELLAEVFSPHGIRVDFTAKPFAVQPGSGLHVHVHLENDEGKNIFFRDGEQFSPALRHAIGGMLALMNPCMFVFAPYKESYLRFTRQSNAPTTVSWGTNNRTVAIRLPNKPLDNKHIEHRVAGSDADPAKVIDAVLAGIFYGIEKQLEPDEPVYGDASLSQYHLPPLPATLEEAQKCAADCNILKELCRIHRLLIY